MSDSLTAASNAAASSDTRESVVLRTPMVKAMTTATVNASVADMADAIAAAESYASSLSSAVSEIATNSMVGSVGFYLAIASGYADHAVSLTSASTAIFNTYLALFGTTDSVAASYLALGASLSNLISNLATMTDSASIAAASTTLTQLTTSLAAAASATSSANSVMNTNVASMASIESTVTKTVIDSLQGELQDAST